MSKKILISYFGYEHDQLKHKIQDKEFLRRFGKDSKTQGYLLDKDPADIKRTDIQRTDISSDVEKNEYETIDMTILRRGVIGVNKVGYVF